VRYAAYYAAHCLHLLALAKPLFESLALLLRGAFLIGVFLQQSE